MTPTICQQPSASPRPATTNPKRLQTHELSFYGQLSHWPVEKFMNQRGLVDPLYHSQASSRQTFRRTASAGAATMARPQPRKERDNASSRWRGPWARPIPRERNERSIRPDYIMRPPGKVFHTMERALRARIARRACSEGTRAIRCPLPTIFP